MLTTPTLPNEDHAQLCKEEIDAAFVKWSTAPRKLTSLSAVYYALKAVLGRAESPASFPDSHPVVSYAERKLVDITRDVATMCGTELEVHMILFVHIILHNKRWKCFLTSDNDKRLLAALFCSFVPDEETSIYHGICTTVSEWSGIPFNPNIKNWENTAMERFFGIGWTHLYMDEVKGNARAKFDILASVMAPIIFEKSNTCGVRQQLPTDLSSFS